MVGGPFGQRLHVFHTLGLGFHDQHMTTEVVFDPTGKDISTVVSRMYAIKPKTSKMN